MKETKNVENTDQGFINKKNIFIMAGVGVSFITIGTIGYVRGYKRAQNIASGIVDCIAEELEKPEDRKTFYNIWNYGVAKYFDKK